MKQRDWTIKQLLTYGKVSRNEALKNFISRLGAIICDLKADGFHIEGKNVKTAYGKDYVYTLLPVKQPLELKKYYVQGELVGQKIIRTI